MLRRCLRLHLFLIALADQTPRKAWPSRPPPGNGFGLDGDPVSEGLLLMDVSLIVAERGVQIVARQVRQLGWETVPCIVLEEGQEREARLWEIAENLHRAELPAVERAEHIDEW